MLPFHNLQATHNLSHAQLYMKFLYRIVWTIPASVASDQNYKRNGNMLPFHNLQATHNLSHAQLYMKLLYIELFERSLPAWVAVRITNGMATDLPTRYPASRVSFSRRRERILCRNCVLFQLSMRNRGACAAVALQHISPAFRYFNTRDVYAEL
jgi:hypothetical protein